MGLVPLHSCWNQLDGVPSVGEIIALALASGAPALALLPQAESFARETIALFEQDRFCAELPPKLARDAP